jgi:hypothetical protein
VHDEQRVTRLVRVESRQVRAHPAPLLVAKFQSSPLQNAMNDAPPADAFSTRLFLFLAHGWWKLSLLIPSANVYATALKPGKQSSIVLLCLLAACSMSLFVTLQHPLLLRGKMGAAYAGSRVVLRNVCLQVSHCNVRAFWLTASCDFALPFLSLAARSRFIAAFAPCVARQSGRLLSRPCSSHQTYVSTAHVRRCCDFLKMESSAVRGELRGVDAVCDGQNFLTQLICSGESAALMETVLIQLRGTETTGAVRWRTLPFCFPPFNRHKADSINFRGSTCIGIYLASSFGN